jgi:hypothetical protein
MGGLELQPFFDLVTIHELGHAFEVLADLRLPTFWLSEIFVNLAMHAFVATQLSASLPTLDVLPTVGAGSLPPGCAPRGTARWRSCKLISRRSCCQDPLQTETGAVYARR